MLRKIGRPPRCLWALLLLMPPIVGYAGSGDPLATMREAPNRPAKGDRLPLAHPAETAWTSCRTGGGIGGEAGLTKQNKTCRDMADSIVRRKDPDPGDGGR
ncbi:hypothetical protein [Hansschlegelia sp. KR7-227]|uniref:hypothetical protein n=1 Tax=Hansschlegelia sp. KR7-227 TaxID=3400914 RepID=UPI003C03D6FF